MGIKVEYNPDLALRNISEYKNGNRKIEECISAYAKASEVLSRPKASIIILEATHFIKDKVAYTKGKYKVVEVFNDDKIYFEGFDRVGTRK